MFDSLTQRLRRTAPAAVGAALTISLLAAGPVFADWESTPGGGNTGQPGGQQSSGGATSYCGPGGAGYLGKTKMYSAPFMGCTGFWTARGVYKYKTHQQARNDVVFTGGYEFCMTGFEVYRFYIKGDPKKLAVGSRKPVAWSASKINLPSVCQPTRTSFTISSPHPDDTGRKIDGDYFRASGNLALNGQNRRFARSAFGGSPTVLPPFDGTVARGGATCLKVQNKDNDPIPSLIRTSWPGGPRPGLDQSQWEAANELHSGMLRIYNQWRTTGGLSGDAARRAALTVINAKNVVRVPKRDRNGKLIKRNGRQVMVDQIVYEDQVPCSSGLDFIATDSRDSMVTYGACYVQVGTYTTTGVVRSTGQSFKQPVFDNPNVKVNGRPLRGGERYLRVYDGNRGLDAPEWRKVIRASRLSKGLTGGPGASLKTTKGWKPWSAAQAATDAASAARCVKGEGMSASVRSNDTNDHEPAGMRAMIDAPDYFQTGGTLRPQVFTVTRTPLLCGGVPCDTSAYRLVRVDWTLDIRSSDNRTYRRCETKGQAGCDFFVELSPANPNMRTSQQATVYFYAATMPGEKIQVRATSRSGGNPTAEYLWTQYKSADVTIWPPTGMFNGMPVGSEPITIEGQTETSRTIRYRIPVRVRGAKDVPVIGAVNE